MSGQVPKHERDLWIARDRAVCSHLPMAAHHHSLRKEGGGSLGTESNSSGLNEAIAVGRTAAQTARTAAQIKKSIACCASKGGICGAVAGAAWGAGKHIVRAFVIILVLLMLPILFILMLPSIIFGGLVNSFTEDSTQPIISLFTQRQNRVR